MSTGKYQKDGVDPVGEGTYGTVWKGVNRENSAEVAMKKVVIRHPKEGLPTTAIREIRALRTLQSHPNVVKMYDVYSEMPGSNGSPGDVYLIFEYAPHDLTGFMAYRKKLKLTEIKCLTAQLLEGLDYCHSLLVMHRDLKPSNILLTNDGTLKLCDFGLCRLVKEAEPGAYTTRVITLWYRPPELLLGCQKYDFSVDIWSAGCIVGEMLFTVPLFPDSAEVQVLKKIRNRLTAFNADDWPSSMRKHQHWEKFWQQINRPVAPGENRDLYGDLKVKHGSLCVDFLKSFIHLDPAERKDTGTLLNHEFLDEEPLACGKKEMKMPPEGTNMKELGIKRKAEEAGHGGKQRAPKRHADEGRLEPSPKRPRAP